MTTYKDEPLAASNFACANKLVRVRFVQGVGSDALTLNSEVQVKFLV